MKCEFTITPATPHATPTDWAIAIGRRREVSWPRSDDMKRAQAGCPQKRTAVASSAMVWSFSASGTLVCWLHMPERANLTVLHYTGAENDRGGIMSVVHALAATGHFGCVLG